LHQAMYLHSAPEEPKELVSLRLTAIGIIDKPELSKIGNAGNEQPGDAFVGRRQVCFDAGQNCLDCSIYARDRLLAGHRIIGPAIIEELTSTTVVPPGWQGVVDTYGHLVLSRNGR